jgi:hypothetical protein
MESLIIMPTPENFTNAEWVKNWNRYKKLFKAMQKKSFWEEKQ